MPTATVIVTTWNGAAYLAETLDSILAQSYTDFELIIVYSQSEDDTREIIASYSDPRITVIDLPLKCGVAIPRNIGLLAARGEYVAMIDHDDTMDPTRLEKQITYLNRHPKVDVLGSSFTLVDGDQRSPRKVPMRDGQIKANLLYLSGSAMHNPTVMFRKQFLDEHRVAYPNLVVDASQSLWVSLMRYGATFANLGESLVDYRYHMEGAARQESAIRLKQKTPIREELLSLLIPDLSGEECRAAAKVMETGRKLTPLESYAGIQAIDKAIRCASGVFGVDVRMLQRILGVFRSAAIKVQASGG